MRLLQLWLPKKRLFLFVFLKHRLVLSDLFYYYYRRMKNKKVCSTVAEAARCFAYKAKNSPLTIPFFLSNSADCGRRYDSISGNPAGGVTKKYQIKKTYSFPHQNIIFPKNKFV